MPDAFRRRSPWELERLEEDALLRYLVSARRHEELEAQRDVHRILVVRYEGYVRSQVMRQAGDMGSAVVEDITQNVLIDMLKPGFRGTSVGEYVARIKAIVGGKVADHHRDAYKRRERETPPPVDEEGRAHDVVDERAEDRRDAAEQRLDAARVVAEELAALRAQNELHAAVVERVWIDDADPVVVGHQHGLSRVNVDKIKSRFKKQLAARLERERGNGAG